MILVLQQYNTNAISLLPESALYRTPNKAIKAGFTWNGSRKNLKTGNTSKAVTCYYILFTNTNPWAKDNDVISHFLNI